MNGVVMEESSETPQQITDENISSKSLLDSDEIDGMEQGDLLGQEIKHNAVKLSYSAPEAIHDGNDVIEKNVTPVIEQKINPCKEIVETSKHPIKSLLSMSTNGIDNNNDDLNFKEASEPEFELENGDGLPEEIASNSKDSSMLSTTDTQDEIDTADNGVQLNSNYLHEEMEHSENIKGEKKINTNKNNESEDSSSEIQDTEPEPQAEKRSKHSKFSQNNETLHESSDEKTMDSPNQNGNKSQEIHEINSDVEDDDCIVTSDNVAIKKKSPKKKLTPDITSLRRSSRAKKRKNYEYDDESDVEILPDSPAKRKFKPIIVNDVKTLANIAKRPVKSMSAQKKEPQLVLIGSNMSTKTATSTKINSSSISASLYQSIVARGTTVTPVGNKPAQTTVAYAGSKFSQTTVTPVKHTPATATQACQTPTQTCQTPTPAILPSLTDDMFVVEAPSFIVPYVYEKPSIEPFKEFVSNLGKQLQEQRAKAEQDEIEKRKLERQEKRDRGEEVVDSEEEARQQAHKKKKIEMRAKRRMEEDDDKSWDGSDSTDSDDFKITDENGQTIEIGKKSDIEEVESNKIVPETAKSENYFDCSLGKFFMNIGMGLVEEYVQNDLLKQQKYKLRREKKSGRNTTNREKSINLLMKNLELSRENNKHYTCDQLKCEHCSFKTESALVLAQHLETPHMKNNMYKCNFCTFEIRSPQEILFHMEAEHNVRGKLERAPSYHQCSNCPFEDNGKGKLARHVIACAKKFKPEQNLNPPFEWEPPAKIPKVAKSRNTLGSPYGNASNAFSRQQFGSGYGRAPSVTGAIPVAGNYRPRGHLAPQNVPVSRVPIAGGSIVRGSSMRQPTTYPPANLKKPNPMSLSITALPRQPPPAHLQPGRNTKGTFVICEICDGYIKDLDQLRNHMQWIHKVKIHPKMIYNRPPLNCQKCQFRFFTDQGLERHLLGSHGLVTSSMQEAANKSKDAGRCPVCGKVYQWKLLNHVARDHNLTLKPAHLSYKCTVCTATFGMYKLFENHVYSAHSVVGKRVMEKDSPKPSYAPKTLSLNDQITITAPASKPTNK